MWAQLIKGRVQKPTCIAVVQSLLVPKYQHEKRGWVRSALTRYQSFGLLALGLIRGTHLCRQSDDYQRVERLHLQRARSPSFTNGRQAITSPFAGVTRRKRDQKETFTWNSADGQTRVWVTERIVHLICYFTGNETLPHFWKCDAKYKWYKAKDGYVLTWAPDIFMRKFSSHMPTQTFGFFEFFRI